MENYKEDNYSKKNSINNDKKGNQYSFINLITMIKSIYRIKQIFSFLSEKKKLNFIIYNKSIQNKMGINLDNYKNESGRYRTIEKDGKGKVFSLDSNKLIFEGQYLNGKKNGKGKEYHYNGNLKFEGEYLNGNIISGIGYDYNNNVILKIKKNGIGVEYYHKGILRFEGEYLNGKKWNGKGKEYYSNGNLKYEYQYINGNFYMVGIIQSNYSI